MLLKRPAANCSRHGEGFLKDVTLHVYHSPPRFETRQRYYGYRRLSSPADDSRQDHFVYVKDLAVIIISNKSDGLVFHTTSNLGLHIKLR